MAPSEIGLHNLKPKPGARKRRKRIGRGEGSGLGKTSGRGHKGAGARSGAKRKVAYEGGQNPIHMRMRKLRGPHLKMSMPFEKFRTEHPAGQPLRPRGALQGRGRGDAGDACRRGRPGEAPDPVKILARGDISKKLDGARARGSAPRRREKIEAAGGSCETLEPTDAAGRSPTPSGSPRSAARSASPRQCSLLYRLGAYIPAPGDRRRHGQGSLGASSAAHSILGFLNLFSGGSLSRLSLFALGIMPYITASIILQLLTVVVPSLERLQKEGEVGQQKITQYTRYLTVGLAFAQSLGYVFLFRSFSRSRPARASSASEPSARSFWS